MVNPDIIKDEDILDLLLHWVKQYLYDTADTGLGKLLVTIFSASDPLKPYAPSYNGRMQELSLLLAPYLGEIPPQ